MSEGFVVARGFVRKLRGGSQPILVEGTDNCLYVLKFNNNMQGNHLPFNESAGTELYKACGLAVPEWKPLFVSDGFLDRNPGCWMETSEGLRRPEAGLCFASCFLGRPGTRLLEILPGTSHQKVRNRMSFWLAWLLDVCSDHTDNRQAIFEQGADGKLDACFIDMGNMFGGPKGDLEALPIASRYLDPRIYADIPIHAATDLLNFVHALNLSKLRRRVLALPEDWKVSSALQRFDQSFDRLQNRDLLREYLETILKNQLRTERDRAGAYRTCYSTEPAHLQPRIAPQSIAVAGCPAFAWHGVAYG